MNGSDTVETRQETTPWGPQGDQLKRFFLEAGDAYTNGRQEFFPGSTVAGFSGDTALSFDLARELATEFNPRDAANEFIGQVAGGAFMPGAGGNPYLDDVFDTMSGRVTEAYQTSTLPGLQSGFAGAGHVGGASSGYGNAVDRSERTLARELGGLADEVYYGDYERRMGDRFKAVGAAGALQDMEQSAIGMLSASGGMQEGMEQRLLDEAMQRFAFAQNEPEARLDRYGNRVGQNLGFGTTTATQPSQGGNAGLSIGLGLLGAMSSLGGAALMAPAGGLAAELFT